MSSHRKIIEITIKAVIDVDTSDWDEPVNSDSYDNRLEDAIEDFFNSTEVSADDVNGVEVHEISQTAYKVVL